jgi:peroxiredoxin Q/BCP
MTHHSHLLPSQPAPVFRVTDIHGEVVDLAELRGSRIWLSFLRFAGCPLANAKVEKIKAWSAQFPGLRPIGVSTAKAAVRQRYCDAGFPIIADCEQALFRLYGAQHSFLRAIVPTNQIATVKAFIDGFTLQFPPERPLWRMPADILIDEAGMVADIHYGKRMHDDISRERIEAFMRANQSVSRKSGYRFSGPETRQ